MRKGLEAATVSPISSSSSITRSPVASTVRPSSTTDQSPDEMAICSGKPTTGRLARRPKLPSPLSLGLPHLSSPLTASRKGSPRQRKVGRIAFQRTGGPGTMGIAGCAGSST